MSKKVANIDTKGTGDLPRKQCPQIRESLSPELPSLFAGIPGDQLPIGTRKNHELVEFALADMSSRLFVGIRCNCRAFVSAKCVADRADSYKLYRGIVHIASGESATEKRLSLSKNCFMFVSALSQFAQNDGVRPAELIYPIPSRPPNPRRHTAILAELGKDLEARAKRRASAQSAQG